jgi:parallel beta-helix repeat protein
MLLLVLVLAQGPRFVELRPGMVITQSVQVARRTYSGGGPPIVVRGNDITIDFRGALLEGIQPESDPELARDTAIIIEGGRNVQLLNGRIRGYKIAILARGTRGLRLRNNDLSYNWKPRLFSLVEHESLVDWLSFHRNEKGEWLRFGAAIYLEDVKGGELRENSVVGGMNALLLVRSDGLMIRDNNFSFNSGLGIGLYRSSDDTIVHNRVDYNVRGYSHRFYTRGQDSADLLLYEQSNRNLVAYNSLTHGGDGVFLWAGQTTMDSGTGGANDNLFYGNDVSHATANGIEATFSRNKIIANKAWGSEYGVWGGYSYETEIIGNDFRGNRSGVAIEHGQDNTIANNGFDRDSTAIRLWADSIAPSEWAYPKHHDTRSRDYRIMDNSFLGNRTTLDIRNTTGVERTGVVATPPPPLAELLSVPSTPLSSRDRSAIIVDEWGPYDYRSPKLWPIPSDSTRAVPLRLATLGPRGSWRVISRHGVASLSQTSGHIGDSFVLTPAPDSTGYWGVTLEYRGEATISPRGIRREKGEPYLFSYERFEPPVGWKVHAGSDSTTGSIHADLPRLDLMWYRPRAEWGAFVGKSWELEALGTVTLPAGTYSIRTISDDAVRVWVDGTLVIDAWTPHESKLDYAPISAGRHDLRVEYRQVDGWVELRVDIIRGTERSTGSPGPH